MISKDFFLFSEPVSGDDPPPPVVAPPPLSSSLPRTGSSLPRTGSFRSTARLIFPKSSSTQQQQQKQEQQQQKQQQQSVDTAPQPKPTQSRFGFKSTWGGANNSRNTSQTKPDDVVAPPANGSRAAAIKPAAIGRAASASQLPGRGGGVNSNFKGVESTSSVTSSTLSRSTVSTSRLVSRAVLSPKPITEEPPPRSSPKPGRGGNVFDGRNSSPKLGQGESRNSPQNGRRDSPKELLRNSPKDLLRNSPRFQRRGVSPSSSPTSSSKPGESHIPIMIINKDENFTVGTSMSITFFKGTGTVQRNGSGRN
jgi:hypothetical protein